MPSRKHVKEQDDAEIAEKADDMGQEPPWPCQYAHKATIESNRKGGQADDGEERQTIVRLVQEEQCRDQPVAKGKNTRNHDGVGSK